LNRALESSPWVIVLQENVQKTGERGRDRAKSPNLGLNSGSPAKGEEAGFKKSLTYKIWLGGSGVEKKKAKNVPKAQEKGR